MGSFTLKAGPEPQADHRDRIIASLEQENRNLQEQLREAREEVANVRNSSLKGVAEIRKLLSPLHQALGLLFGEIERIAPGGVEPSSNAPQQSDKKRAVWESWIKKLGGLQAEFVKALLEHDVMTAAQLRVAMHCGKDSVYGAASKLGRLGLIQQNGGKYSLKEL